MSTMLLPFGSPVPPRVLRELIGRLQRIMKEIRHGDEVDWDDLIGRFICYDFVWCQIEDDIDNARSYAEQGESGAAYVHLRFAQGRLRGLARKRRDNRGGGWRRAA